MYRVSDLPLFCGTFVRRYNLVDSKAGIRECSRLRLPEQAAMGEPSIEIDKRVAASPTILVVEDEVLVRLALADELREAGCRVVETICADEALTILRGGAYFDLVLTDVQMPGSLDGYGLARVIRSEFPDIKIVVASAHAANDTDVADATFLKPYDFDTLVASIKNLLA